MSKTFVHKLLNEYLLARNPLLKEWKGGKNEWMNEYLLKEKNEMNDSLRTNNTVQWNKINIESWYTDTSWATLTSLSVYLNTLLRLAWHTHTWILHDITQCGSAQKSHDVNESMKRAFQRFKMKQFGLIIDDDYIVWNQNLLRLNFDVLIFEWDH